MKDRSYSYRLKVRQTMHLVEMHQTEDRCGDSHLSFSPCTHANSSTSLPMNIFTLFYLLAFVIVCSGLSVGEERAISSLFEEWPILSSAHPPWSANASLACSGEGFYGISCSQPPETHVLSLILEDIKLAGSMPSEITDLLWLEVLKFENASLVGSIPSDLGKLRNLTTFSVEQFGSTSSMSGSIPDSISNLGELEELVLRADGLSGNLPLSFGGASGEPFPSPIGCQKLKKLVLNSARIFADDPVFGGEIPFSLCQLDELAHLDLSNTDFSQVRCIGRWPKMEELRLASMPLNGDLTLDFLTRNRSLLRLLDLEDTKMRGGIHLNATLTPHLSYMNLKNCFLSGEISGDLWLLPNLTDINFQHNTLTGPISSKIGFLSKLEHVDLSFTSISGSIPSSLGNCYMLQYLNLANTQVSGEIPETLANASNIKFLDLSFTNLDSTIPTSMGRLKKLEYMLLESVGLSGTIPEEMTEMTNLVYLNMRLNRLAGAIPPFGQSFDVIDLSGNLLEGEIPSMVLSNGRRIDLSKNRLSGSIPSSVGFNDNLVLLDLSANILSGSLPIMRQTWNVNLDTGNDHNRVSNASITHLKATKRVYEHVQVVMESFGNEKKSATLNNAKESIVFRLGSNMLSGAIPLGYGNVRFREVNVADNILSGGVPFLFELDSTKDLEVVDLRSNEFDSILSEIRAPKLRILLIGGNKFGGDLRVPYSPLTTLDISHNHFTRSVFMSLNRGKLFSTLEDLDMSANEIYGTIPPFLFALPSLKFLSLSKNNLTGSIPRPPHILTSSAYATFGTSSFESIDLSFNQLTGSWPYHPTAFLDLRALKLSHNQLSGGLHLDSSPVLESLEISNNLFSFDANQFSSRPFLSYLDAQNNLIYGLLSFKGSNTLKTADLSRNRLDQQPDLFSISSLFSLYSLFYLSILNNPLIPPYSQIDPEMLNKTTASSPSLLSTGVTCYHLSFLTPTLTYDADLTFLYDEELFGYLQCECDTTHFGLPPSSCFPCPSRSSPSAFCSANTLQIPSNTYIFKLESDLSPADPPLAVEPCLQSLILERSNCLGVSISYQFDISSETRMGKRYPQPSSTSSDVIPLKKHPKKQVEMRSHAERHVTMHKGDSTILNFHRTAVSTPLSPLNMLNYSLIPSTNALIDLQCRSGSSGRLCSKCDCDLSVPNPSNSQTSDKSNRPKGVCYFPGPGNICTQCKYVFRTIESVMFGIGLVFIVTIVLTLIFFLVLRSKRSEKDTEWDNLHLGKRIIYRLVYATSLGYLPILITFLQLGVELTDWNGYAVRLWMNMINAQSSAPLCLFPSLLSHPLPRLLLRLFLPFFVVLVVATCVGLAESIFRKVFHNSPHQKWSRKHKLGSYSTISSSKPVILDEGNSSVSPSSQLQPPHAPLLNERLNILEVVDDECEALSVLEVEKKQNTRGILTDASPLLPSSSAHTPVPLYTDEDIEDKKEPQGEKGQPHTYPALALVSSVSISVLRFFYFGTALSAFEYVFSVEQAVTKAKYVQSVPWMKFEDAVALRSVSVPFIVVFLLGLPLLYLLWGWKVRKLLDDIPPSPSASVELLDRQIDLNEDLISEASEKRRRLKQYSGTLFHVFKPAFFWWEMVNITKKLSIALVLRMTSEAGIAQPFSVVFLIGFFQLLSSTWRPWKRLLENILEGVGALFLLLSLLASRLVRNFESSTLSSFSHPLLIFSLILDLLFIFACICIIFYETITGETDYQRQWKERFRNSSSRTNRALLPSMDVTNVPYVQHGEKILHPAE